MLTSFYLKTKASCLNPVIEKTNPISRSFFRLSGFMLEKLGLTNYIKGD